MCEEMLGAEGANLTKLLLGGFDALHKRMEKLAADVVDDGWSDAARAAVNLLDDLGALFSHLHNGVKRGDGPEAVVAVRDTLRLLDVHRAAMTGTVPPVRRDVTLRGLDRNIARRQTQIDLVRKVGPENAIISTHDNPPPYPLDLRTRELETLVAARNIIGQRKRVEPWA